MMKLSDMVPLDDVISYHRSDPEFARAWDRTGFAREIATKIVTYRTEHGITQEDLARATGMKQPVIARLETGEQAPSLATLAKLSRTTDLEFHLDVEDGAVALAA